MSERNDTILLTGVHGQVGGQLLPLLQTVGRVVAPTRAELDLTDADATRHYVRAVRPRWIVNSAAYTAVDKAEKEPELAYAVNAIAPRVLGEEAGALGVPVLHFSTDYVFDGSGSQPRVETEPTGPLGVYGASKLEGERKLAASGVAHVIFRTSWVYGASGSNFLRTILRLASERDEVKIVADQYGSPTWSHDLARMVLQTIRRCEAQSLECGTSLSSVVDSIGGVYHACNAGYTTWFGFASEFLRLARLAAPERRYAALTPITTAEYPTPARRPVNSRMNCEKLATKLGFTMPEWQHSTAKVMREIFEREGEAGANPSR